MTSRDRIGITSRDVSGSHRDRISRAPSLDPVINIKPDRAHFIRIGTLALVRELKARRQLARAVVMVRSRFDPCVIRVTRVVDVPVLSHYES